TNYLDFTNAKDLLHIRYEVFYEGVLADWGIIENIDLLPHESREITLPTILDGNGNCSVLLTYIQNKDLPPTSVGHILGFDQLFLANTPVLPEVNPVEQEDEQGLPITLEESNRLLILTGKHFRYTFDKAKGLFQSINYKNKEYLPTPMEYNIWRAPIDNDREIRKEWERAGYNRAQSRVYDTAVESLKDGITINCHLSLTPIYLEKILDIKATFTILSNGNISATLSCQKNMEMPFLPRFGILLTLPKQMEQTEYFGYGPYESYEDKHQASYLGLFQTTAKKNHEDYIKPQENGSHFGCHFVKIMDDCKRGICITSNRPFSFHISPYTQEELTTKRHNFELVESDTTQLAIDYRQSGVGSNSCGPRLNEAYQFNEKNFTFQFDLAFM
ncbi:MAG: beta-galactosidase small subunit family protein, partial [Lachnospiraceae bacterium]